MTSYPNREHENADRAAMRRALHTLEGIRGEANDLHLRLSRDQRVDADDAQVISGKVRDLTGYLAELATLRDVREWHAADQQKPKKICISCEQEQGQTHLSWCPVVTGRLSSLDDRPVNDLGGQDPHPRYGADEAVT